MLTVTGACDSKVTLDVVDNTKVQLSVDSTVIDKTWQQLKEAGLSSGLTTQ